MNTTFVSLPPSEIIERLFNEDRDPAGTSGNHQTRLSTEQREHAINWLRRILVDFSALDEHVAQLQELYDAPFTYSRPGSRLDLENPTTSGEPNKFRYHERLTENQVTEILNEGVAGLLSAAREDELRQLLLNPIALYDLFDVIDEIQPDHWLAEMTDLAKHLIVPNSATADMEVTPRARVDAVKKHPESIMTTAPSDDFWRRFQQIFIEALRQSQRPPVDSNEPVLVREASSQYSQKWQYALATAATIVIAVMAGSVFRLTTVLSDLSATSTQQAEINRLTNESHDLRKAFEQLAQQTHSNVGLVPTSNGQPHSINWPQFLKVFYNPKLSDEDNLKSLEQYGGPEINNKVSDLRKTNPQITAHDILKELFSAFGKPGHTN